EDGSCIALTLEKAAREILDGDVGEAADTLRAGLRRVPDSPQLRVLMLGLAGASGDDDDLAEALEVLSRSCEDPALAEAMAMAFVVVEERRGRTETAAACAERAAAEGSAAAAWAGVRLAMRGGEAPAVSAALGALERTASAGALGAGFARLRAAYRACAEAEGPPGDRGVAAGGESWDLSFVESLRRSDRGAEAAAARIGAERVATPWLAEGLEESALLVDRRAGGTSASSFGARAGASRTAALAGFLAPDDREDAEALFEGLNEAPALALGAALSNGRPEIAARALGVIQADAANADAIPEIAVARATLQRNALRDPEAALETLGAAMPTPATPPLASLIRLHRRAGAALAEVSLAEAAVAEDPDARSWHLAWAARHLFDSDPKRAEELYGEALRESPTCGLALYALERIGGNHAETARAWLAAAGSCADEAARCRNLVAAGVHFAVAGEVERAGRALGAAVRIDRGDKALAVTALRLAVDGPADLPIEAGEFELAPGDDLSADDVLAIASSCLHRDPALALRCFEWLCDALPGDPVLERGLADARLASGRWSEVSSAYLERLKNAQTPAEEAHAYARLAEIDRHFGNDESSAVLSQIEVANRLPGHRSTLASLIIRFARHEREDDLVGTLYNVALAVDDERDAAAAAAASFRLSPLSINSIRVFAERSPASLYAAAELEARAESSEESLACLRRLAGGPRAAAVNVSRLADALEDAGQIAEALAVRTRSLELSPESQYDLLGLERLQHAAGDSSGLLWTTRRMAELTMLPARRRAYLLEAARIAADEVHDVSLGGQLALTVLREVPGDDEVYAAARRLIPGSADLGYADDVIEARLTGVEGSAEKRELLIELAEVRERRGDAAGAKDALERIVAIYPADVDTRRALSGLRQRDGEWAEAITHLMEAARHTQDDPVVGVGLFYELGTLYQFHGGRPDLAEKCYVKVLGWERGHFDAMERLSEVYAQLQNWPRAAQALEHLITMTSDPFVRTAKTVALAEILDRHLNRPREAEQMLNEVRRAAPLDVRPVESLAAIYSRQRDSLALNVLLDQALVTNANAVGESPGEVALYSNLLAILSMKADDDLAAMAETALSMMGAEIPEKYKTNRAEPWWNVGARVGDGTIDDFLCPKEVTPGMRGTLLVIEDAVSKLLGLNAKNIATSGAARLDKRHALAQMVAQYAPMFGVKGEPPVYAAEIGEIRVAPGSPPAILVPKVLTGIQEEPVLRFAAAAALGLCRNGLALATMLTNEQLRLLVACCVKLSIPSFELPGVDPRALNTEVERLRPAITAKLVERIQPLSFDCAPALEHAQLRESVMAVGDRAGFMSAGTFSAAITALRVLSGRQTAPFEQVPGLGRLMQFVFSKIHVELRQRMGI
ncbi:MAG: hypothetical protein M0R80_16295, partial [Proteobacteria bacterium]|nr:hypothetical protein [Pseudomonadota bacterium]